MFKYIAQIWKSKDLRNKILFTLGIIVIYRLVSQISIPGANIDSIRAIFAQNQILGIYSLMTGGSIENFSIVLMGLSPYINASIIIQLMTVVIPRLEELSKEGEHGRRKINQYTRWLTIPLAVLQSYGMIVLLNSQAQIPIISDIENPMVILPVMLTITTGTIFLMWLGELISEKGIGNGISMLIFAGIIAGIPSIIGQSLALAGQETERLIPFVIMTLLTLILLVGIIMITEGHRKIPITYAGRAARGEQASLPIRINQAGMIPIIFAISIVTFPTIIAQFLQNSPNATIATIAGWIMRALQVNSVSYLVIYFLLIIAFSYFYVSITFNPDDVAENIQKRGGYIPGMRPGRQTADFLRQVSNRLNLWGGTFLALVAIIPIIAQNLLSGFSFGSVPMIMTGAGMIIIVGVVLELIRQVNAQLVMHDYDKLY